VQVKKRRRWGHRRGFLTCAIGKEDKYLYSYLRNAVPASLFTMDNGCMKGSLTGILSYNLLHFLTGKENCYGKNGQFKWSEEE
jgi:hypothetical protein